MEVLSVVPRPGVWCGMQIIWLLAACGVPPAGDTPTSHDTESSTHDTVSGPRDSSPVHDTSLDSDSPSGDTAPEDAWRSALYPRDWSPGFAVEGAFLHDFSYAGYHNGEEALPGPSGTRFSVVDHGADPSGTLDSTAAIQTAIDAATQAGGGEVHLPAGEYRCDDLLRVEASGIVLTGEGPDTTRIFFTRSHDMTEVNHLTFVGDLTQGEDRLLVADAAAMSTTLELSDATGLSIGDDVAVGWVISEAFVADHGMSDTWAISNGQWRPFFRRTVMGVDTATSPHRITLDVPLRYDALLRDEASVRLETGHIAECGVEALAISTVVEWDEAWSNDLSHAIGFSGVEDCWVRDVVSYSSPNARDERGSHLQSGGIFVVHSKRVTVADSTMENAQNRGDGGNGYLFHISRSSDILITDSVARSGRHNFVQNWDFGASGLVFLRTTSEEGRAVSAKNEEAFYTVGFSEFHHSLAMANLIDQSIVHDGWKAANRGDYSSGAGHAATQSVFWNLSGEGYVLSYQYGLGYVIGTTDVGVDTTVWDIFDSEGTAPEDYTEGLDEGDSLLPRSLYEDQRARRLERGEALWPRP